jgi:lysozyme
MAEITTTSGRRAGGLVGAALTACIATVAVYEGVRTHAYRDVVGVKTVCYGHTNDVQMGDHYTLEFCKHLLGVDLQKYYDMVRKCVTVDMPPHRTAAIVSFTYNIGGYGFCRSSVAKALQAGHIQQACNNLLRYTHGGGRVIQGLVRRRQGERQLCLRND